ncbi:hypothetical protein TNCV_4432701 [Trichonephila clavipes]|nr:hypothetical protein TNCV_4432701 [Trichonephila clavipes]
MGIRHISLLLYVIGWMWRTLAIILYVEAPVLWLSRLLYLTPIHFFPMGPSQGRCQFDMTEQAAKRCLKQKRNHAKQHLLSLE